ncbi:MAG: NIPSNAP family protein [Myxococcaceae bacterium]
MPVIEMRTYWTVPGMREEFLKVFVERSIPIHRELGMPIIGPFLGVEDPDTFFFMRVFPSAAEREELKRRFYEGEPWKSELEQRLMPLLARWEVMLVDDTPGLTRQLLAQPAAGC